MTLRFLLDTNLLSEPARAQPDPAVIEKLKAHQDEVASASVVWHELVYGCELLPPGSKKRSVLEQYLLSLESSSLPILAYDTKAARWHAGERARLSSKGLTPPFADGQIAAIAKVNGLIVVTNNTADFRHFEGLEVERWHSENVPESS